MTSKHETDIDLEDNEPERAEGSSGDRAKDPSYLSGPSVRDARRSYVEEQYPTLVKNNRLRTNDLVRLREEASAFRYRPLISIPMPLLNPELRWLERALDSAIGQVYPDWELCICCGDPTEEHVKDLLSRYKRLDERIKVRHLEQMAARLSWPMRLYLWL